MAALGLAAVQTVNDLKLPGDTIARMVFLN